MANILIMAGGTGGHVFPALAVANRLIALGHQVSWMGTQKGLEAKIVPSAGIELDYVQISGLRGRGALGWLLAPVRLLKALSQSMSILSKRKPDTVLGMGGFVSGPGGLAAAMRRIPLVIHEQNAVAGLTNRLLRSVASSVLQAFPGTLQNGIDVGNPVRPEIAALPEPEQRFSQRDPELRLLVVGGSLGAKVLNEQVPAALHMLPKGHRAKVIHQAGEGTIEIARKAYADNGIEAEVTPFLDDMARAYGWADVVICRAGALTISELAAAGVGSLLIPFPHAVDDHQTQNATFLVDRGGAEMVKQQSLTPAVLAERLMGWVEDASAGRKQLLAMAQAARGVANTDATQSVVDVCLSHSNKGKS